MPRTKGALGRKTLQRLGWEIENSYNNEQLRLRDHLLNFYGMSPTTFVAHFAPSHCPICGDKLTLEKRGTHIDHVHGTTEIRGILCRECNIMLGKARDNPFILIAAAMYLNSNGVKLVPIV